MSSVSSKRTLLSFRYSLMSSFILSAGAETKVIRTLSYLPRRYASERAARPYFRSPTQGTRKTSGSANSRPLVQRSRKGSRVGGARPSAAAAFWDGSPGAVAAAAGRSGFGMPHADGVRIIDFHVAFV